MCQAEMQVWMALEHGSLVAVNNQSFKIEREIRELEARDNLVQIINLGDHTKSTALALGYKSGVVVFVKFSFKFAHGLEVKSLGIDILSNLENELSTVKLASPQLCTIETCKPQKSQQFEVWCGCNNSVIEIVALNNATPKVLNTHSISADIPADASIIQLKSTPTNMYALHSGDNVISCWSVCEQPVLNTVIKLTQLKSPSNQLISHGNSSLL